MEPTTEVENPMPYLTSSYIPPTDGNSYNPNPDGNYNGKPPLPRYIPTENGNGKVLIPRLTKETAHIDSYFVNEEPVARPKPKPRPKRVRKRKAATAAAVDDIDIDTETDTEVKTEGTTTTTAVKAEAVAKAPTADMGCLDYSTLWESEELAKRAFVSFMSSTKKEPRP